MQEQEAASAGAEEEKRTKEKQKQHRHHHHKRSNRPASAQKITSSPKKSKTAHSPSPPMSKKADKMETSPPPPAAPAEAGKADHSKKSSRCSTASKSVNGQLSGSRPISSTSLHSSNKSQAKGSCHNSITTAAEQSRACSSNREAVSGTETIIVSRCSKCRSVVSSTSLQEQSRSASSRSYVGGGRASSKSATSVRSGSTRVSSTLASERGLEKRAELKAEAVRKDLHQ